jgi:hypothetical protein
MSIIHLPGRGAVDLATRKVDLAVNEYDERLFAAKNPRNGLDTIFIKMSPFTDWMTDDGLDIDGQRCIPVMAFPEGYPSPAEVLSRIYAVDAVRRGAEILDEINKHNESLKEAERYTASESAGETAEVMESVMHRLGHTSYHRSLPMNGPRQRAGR